MTVTSGKLGHDKLFIYTVDSEHFDSCGRIQRNLHLINLGQKVHQIVLPNSFHISKMNGRLFHLIAKVASDRSLGLKPRAAKEITWPNFRRRTVFFIAWVIGCVV